MRASCILAAALLAALGWEASWTAAAVAHGEEAPRIAQLASSVLLTGPWDYLPYNASNSQRTRCTDMVDRASEYVVTQIQFLPTFFWVDEGPLDPPPGFDPTCKNSDLGSYYCYNRFNATRVKHWCYLQEGGSCHQVNETQIEALVQGLDACLQYAVDLGFDHLTLDARVDDGLALGGWRNTLSFNPLEVYGNYSYLEAILFPLADAAAGVLGHGVKVDFVMQGEMGATAFFYPEEWALAKELLLDRVAESGAQVDHVRVGLGMNNNKLCGCININITDGFEYLGNFSSAFSKVQSEFDLRKLEYLFTSVDFLGLSAYIPQRTPWFKVCDLEGLMERLDFEFGHYNLSLAKLASQGVGIEWIEFGVGGGASPTGDRRAETAVEAARNPWWGVWGDYSCERDPWQLCYPDTPSEVRDYSRYVYNKTAEYLEQGGCAYHVDAVFIWNVGSHDIQGIYPPSTTAEGSYRDPVIADIINRHNELAIASEVSPPAAVGGTVEDGVVAFENGPLGK